MHGNKDMVCSSSPQHSQYFIQLQKKRGGTKNSAFSKVHGDRHSDLLPNLLDYLTVSINRFKLNKGIPMLHRLLWQHDAYLLSAHVSQQLHQPQQSTETRIK